MLNFFDFLNFFQSSKTFLKENIESVEIFRNILIFNIKLIDYLTDCVEESALVL
jgi:hypothetical protein